MKKGRNALFALLTGVVLFSSCNKETTLENRLEGKWNVDSFVRTERVETKTVWTGFLSDSDTDVEITPDENTTEIVTGTIDFVSDSKLVMDIEINTTSIIDGVTTKTKESDNVALEYYVSAEDEITLVDDWGGHTVYEITTNEKESQVWERNDVEVETTDVSATGQSTNETVTTTLTEKITLSVAGE